MALLLGIDVGTTNTKLRVYNHDGEIKEERSFPTPLFPDEEGVISPQKILHQILQAISQFSGNKREIIALSVSSYAEVLVKVGENGEPVVEVFLVR